MTERSPQAATDCRSGVGASLVLAITLAVIVSTLPLSSQGTSATPPRPSSPDVTTGAPVVASGTIRGRVVDASSNQPLSGVRIQLSSHTAFTDNGGRFTMAGVATGGHEVVASKAGYVTTWRRQRTPGEFQIAGPRVEVAAGQIVDGVDFALSKGGVITGRVVDARGRDVIGARVFTYRSRWRDSAQDITQSNVAGDRTNDLGEFRLFGLPAGTYLIGANGLRPAADGLFTVYYPGSFGSDEAEPITIRSGEERTVTITMPPASTSSIAGTVLGEDGRPQTGIQVYAQPTTRENTEQLRSTAGTDGSFRFSSLLPGEYEVFATGPYVPPTEARLRTFARARVAVDNNNVAVRLTLTTGGELRGRYRFDTGAPPADVNPPTSTNAGVEAVLLPHADGQRVTVLADWSFAITGLGGTYRLIRPYRPNGWWVKRVTRDGQDITFATLTIGDETIDGVEILLTQKITHLSVSLEGADAAIDDATVVVFAEDESRLWPRTPFVRVARATERRSTAQSLAQSLQWHDSRSVTMSGLPPVRYYAVAVAGLEPGQETSPALLRQLKRLASSVELVDYETRSITLTVVATP